MVTNSVASQTSRQTPSIFVIGNLLNRRSCRISTKYYDGNLYSVIVGVWPARFGAILYVRIFFRRGLLDFLDREHRVRVSAAGTHLRSDPDRFHNLFSRCTMSQGGFSVATYAVGTLRDMGDGDSD